MSEGSCRPNLVRLQLSSYIGLIDMNRPGLVRNMLGGMISDIKQGDCDYIHIYIKTQHPPG